MTRYEYGFLTKCAEHGVPEHVANGMLKQARNIGRLLARVGSNLAGATDKELKFIARRGLKGLSPEQVKALRARGMLPSVEQELAGFNRGTKNMLNGAEVHYGDAASHGFRMEPATKNGPAKVFIPEIRTDVSIPEQEVRASLGRHEAREFVRNNAAERRGGFDPRLDEIRKGQIGSSHMPGVMYDERVFRSQLSNRLGLNTKWDDLPLDLKFEHARAPRESYIGSKPLKYEFDLINQWKKMRASEMEALRREAVPFMNSPEVSNGLTRDIQSTIEGIGKLQQSKPPSFDDVRGFITDEALGHKGIGRKAIYSLPYDSRHAIFDLSSKYDKKLYDYLANKTGIDPSDVGPIMHGYSEVKAPAGSEVGKVMDMGYFIRRLPPKTPPQVKQTAAVASKGMPPRPSFLERLKQRFFTRSNV